MKDLKVLTLVLVVGLALVGCEEKNQEYYSQHIDSAKEKLDDCLKTLYKAIMQSDQTLFNKITQDTECQAASDAIKKDPIEQKIKEAKEKQALESELIAIKKQIAGKSWQESINKYLEVEECNSLFLKTSPQCKAWKMIYNEKVDEGKKELIKLPFEGIKEQMHSLCKLYKGPSSNCSLAELVLEEKAKEDLANADIQTVEAKKSIYCAEDINSSNACSKSWNNAWNRESDKHIKFFTENDEEFINTFNSCVDKVAAVDAQKLEWSQKNDLERQITDTYPCYQAKMAYSKRGMGYSVRFEKKIEK